MMGWNMGWGGGMFFGGFLSLLILVGVVVLAVRLLRNTGSTPSSYGKRGVSNDEPLRILQTRYANGEINQEEYETKRRDLGTSSGSGS